MPGGPSTASRPAITRPNLRRNRAPSGSRCGSCAGPRSRRMAAVAWVHRESPRKNAKSAERRTFLNSKRPPLPPPPPLRCGPQPVDRSHAFRVLCVLSRLKSSCCPGFERRNPPPGTRSTGVFVQAAVFELFAAAARAGFVAPDLGRGGDQRLQLRSGSVEEHPAIQELQHRVMKL